MGSNRDVFANLMNVEDKEIRRMISAIDTVLDVRQMKQEYSELKKYFRDYKNGIIKLESDEDRKAHSDKLSEYLRLQREIKGNNDETLQTLQNAPEESLIREHKRLSVFYRNFDHIKWAEEKLAEKENAKKRYEEAEEEKSKFADEEKELKSLKRELREYKNGQRKIEDRQEYGEKLSRFLELDRKKKEIDKNIKDAQSGIESISDKDIEKAEKIIEITTDENNWDMLMQTSLDSLLNEPQKPEEKKPEEKKREEKKSKEKKSEEKKSEEKKREEKKPKEKKSEEKDPEAKPRMSEIQNGQVKPLNQEISVNSAPNAGANQEPKADKPICSDTEEPHLKNSDYYLEEVDWKENLKRLPSDIINLIKDVRAAKKEEKERFIKEYKEENGKRPSRLKVFLNGHKRINKVVEFFKSVVEASQSLTPEEQQYGAIKYGYAFKNDRENAQNSIEVPTPSAFKERQEAFKGRVDVDITPEPKGFEDISSNPKDNAKPEVAVHTEAGQNVER